MGEVKYDAGQNSVIWQLDFVDKSATESQIIEFSSFALTGMDGQLTFENDSKKDILKLDKVQIEKEAQWQDLSVEKEESFRTCLKMSF